jgi:hypothetical protein
VAAIVALIAYCKPPSSPSPEVIPSVTPKSQETPTQINN